MSIVVPEAVGNTAVVVGTVPALSVAWNNRLSVD